MNRVPSLLNQDLLAEQTAKLERTIAALEGFCYTIAHDLRAPLRSMQGFAQALLEDYSERLDAEGIDYAQRISSAARRMDQMIKELLDFEQLAIMEPILNRLQLEALVDKVVANMAEEVRLNAAQVEIQRPLAEARGNRALLEKIVRELLSNALRFIAPGTQPHIKIWTERGPDSVLLVVQDNGVGIAPEHQREIFEPFTRLYRHDTYAGTGIGLAIVKRSAERMGGWVELESEPGGGARFRIHLPAAS